MNAPLQQSTNADPSEVRKFSDLAHRWWDPNSEFKPLHDINPLRLNWIDQAIGLNGKKVIDIGCGGGILSESMAAKGAQVTGIDLSDKALSVAKLHLLESGLTVDYRHIAAEAMAAIPPMIRAPAITSPTLTPSRSCWRYCAKAGAAEVMASAPATTVPTSALDIFFMALILHKAERTVRR